MDNIKVEFPNSKRNIKKVMPSRGAESNITATSSGGKKKDIDFEDKIFIGCISRKLKHMDRASLLMLVTGICDILEKKNE